MDTKQYVHGMYQLLLTIVRIEFISAEDLSNDSGSDCSWIKCYNAGTVIIQGQQCACKCPPRFSGILCENEMKKSEWPVGPYALFMPSTGCPETDTYGWSPGYINITTLNPIEMWILSNGSKYSIRDSEHPTKLAGPFGNYTMQLNFCFKHVNWPSVKGNIWPAERVNVFGVLDGCPIGMAEEERMISLPEIRSWWSDGYLPHFEIRTGANGTFVLTKECILKETETRGNVTGSKPFILMKREDMNCTGIHGTDVEEETLKITQRNVIEVTNTSIGFCIYIPKDDPQEKPGPIPPSIPCTSPPDCSEKDNGKKDENKDEKKDERKDENTDEKKDEKKDEIKDEIQDAGSTLNCDNQLGLIDGSIEDYQITASSWDRTDTPHKARAFDTGWCPAVDDPSPYIQIDMFTISLVGGLTLYQRVNYIDTIQHNIYSRRLVPEGCRSFMISYGVFPDSFVNYTERPFTTDTSQTFEQPQTFKFLRPFLARYIRIHPQEPVHGGRLCLRLELLGCSETASLSSICDKDSRIYWSPLSSVTPTSLLSADPSLYTNISSVEDCRNACKTQIGQCKAIEYVTNETCSMYTSPFPGTSVTAQDKSQSTRSLLVCLIDPFSPDYISLQPNIDITTAVIVSNKHVLTSAGYPIHYKSNTRYKWEVTSAHGGFIRLTFALIDLYNQSVIPTTECPRDTLRFGNLFKNMNYMQNGLTPTFPTDKEKLEIIFNTCERVHRRSDRRQGFRVIVKIEGSPTIWTEVLHSPVQKGYILSYSNAGIGGKLPPEQVWVYSSSKSKGLCILTVSFFNVPCVEESYMEILDGVNYNERLCNEARRPLREYRAWDMRISFRYLMVHPKIEADSGFRAYFWVDPFIDFPSWLSETNVTNSDLDDNVTDDIAYHHVCSSHFNKCYRYSRRQKYTDWTTHAKSCHRFGYRHLVIHNRKEMHHLQTLLLRMEKDYLSSLNDKSPPSFIYTHIGLIRYHDSTGRFRHIWQDGTSLTFTAWGTGEPYNAREHMCTGMRISLTTGIGDWVSFPCTSNSSQQYVKAFVSICEKSHEQLNNAGIVHSDSSQNANISVEPQHKEMLFQCNSTEWVVFTAVCDGVSDCYDGSDEANCSLHELGGTCLADEFTCRSGNCIHVGQVCDFVENCPDGSDEYCTFPECKADEFTCSNKQCVPLYTRCDAVSDCFDASDEYICSRSSRDLRTRSCNETIAFSCGDMTCIARSLVCDNVPNCDDGRDEVNCARTFYTCQTYWEAGFDTNFTKRESVGGFHLECQFVIVDTHLLRITAILEFASLWFNTSSNRKREVVAIHADVFKDHGEICTIEISERCLYNINEIASYTEPAYSGSYSFCRPKSVQIFTDGKQFWVNGVHDIFSTLYFEIRGSEVRFHSISQTDEGSSYSDYSVKIGPVVCTTLLNLTSINCGDGMTVSRDHRCLYEYTRAGTIDGCRTFKHLEDCENFVCPFGFSKCPSSFCVAQRLVCDGERQCPGGEDEIDCWCGENNYTVLIAYHGATNNRSRINPDELMLARQFYSPNASIYEINYFDINNRYKVSVREVQFFNEVLNLENKQTFETNTNSLESELISRFGIKGHVNIINIEPEDMLIRKPFMNVSNIDHVYHVRVDNKIQRQADVQTYRGGTNISVKSLRLLSKIGSKLFPSLCKETSSSRIIMGFKCISSTIYIPTKQLCDGVIQCPFGDDEAFCGFQCPTMCSCKPYIANCKSSGFREDDLNDLDPATRILDFSYNNVFKNGKLFISKKLPYLIKLYAKQCKLVAITDRTFINATSLIHLDLSFNEIRVLRTNTFVGLKYVNVLKLNGNAFLSILEPNAFRMFSLLNDVSITESVISEIVPYTFSGLKLNTLNISNNKIRTIHVNAFSNLTAKQIIFDGNDITNFDNELFLGVQNLNSIRSPAFKFCCYKPSSVQTDDCWPHEDEFSSCEDLMKNSILQTLLWLVGASALVGNGVTIMYRLINDRRKIKKGFGLFVLNLAISDFLMGVYLIIIATADIIFRKRYIIEDEYWRKSIWCNIAGILANVSSEASVGFMCLITVERLLVIKFPFGQWRLSARTCRIAVTVIWCISAILALIPILVHDYFQNSFYSTSGVCLAMPLTRRRPPGWLYSFIIYVAVNFVAFILIAIGQLAIFIEIRRSSKRMEQFKSQRRNDISIAKNLLLVLTTDFLCWFPIGVMAIMAYGGHVIPGDVYAWTAVLILPINSALNPFLYTLSALIGVKNITMALQRVAKVTTNYARERRDPVFEIEVQCSLPTTTLSTMSPSLQQHFSLFPKEQDSRKHFFYCVFFMPPSSPMLLPLFRIVALRRF